MRFSSSRYGSSAFLVVALAMLLASAGCVGVTNWLFWVVHGRKVDAEYGGLREKRVAVICVTRSSPFDPGGTTGSIARSVSLLLSTEVKNIDVVEMDEVADWIDRHGWNEMDYRVVGRGVNADMVLAIEFDTLSFQDNSTTVQGRADFKVKVYDVAKGTVVFARETTGHEYPSDAPAIMPLRRFQAIYIQRLSTYIAQYFYDHDFTQDFGNDALVLR
jgi:hypothetical protein